ncbi:MAG TPA: hypothetical protein DD640_04650 [Clostridiales bacterium]|nr:hypothetical protein [Clostridiales bacterium]
MLDLAADLAGGIIAGIAARRGLRRDARAFYQRYIAGFLINWPEKESDQLTGGEDAPQDR